MKTIFKVLAIIFMLYFLWAAYVQNNDPDAILWYAIYGISAIVSLLFLFDKLPFVAAISLFVCFIGGVIFFWPTAFEGVTIGEGDIKNIEEGRESLGLLINAIVMLLFAWRIKADSN